MLVFCIIALLICSYFECEIGAIFIPLIFIISIIYKNYKESQTNKWFNDIFNKKFLLKINYSQRRELNNEKKH